MCILRMLSWNLRTFGAPSPPDQALLAMASIIANLQPDVVTVQEVQIGLYSTGEIGSPISPEVVASLNRLLVLLQAADPGAGWLLMVSPINNSGRAKSMSDAYAFFWKTYPAQSGYAHADPVQVITCLQNPVILRRQGPDLKGRRPGMIVLEVRAKAGDLPIPLKVISWHAPTPCNALSKYGQPSAGRGLLDLAYLSEIGGVTMQSGYGGWQPYQPVHVMPLPAVDTIFLADTNFAMNESKATIVYNNLTTNYTPCVSTPDHIVRTTYSSDPTQPLRNPSSYDNIFILNPHPNFAPCFTFNNNSGAFDFIKEAAEKLGSATEMKFFATEAAWYVIFLDNYKRQYQLNGVSDHLPVWADFTINRNNHAGSDAIKPTSGADNNCAFHAIFGALNPQNGFYIDPTAVTRRSDYADWLGGVADLEAIRQPLLVALIEVCSQLPDIVAGLQRLANNPMVPLKGWSVMAKALRYYLNEIREGRPLQWQDVVLVAIWQQITIRLWTMGVRGYVSQDLNPGQQQLVHIYHFGPHFFHYESN